MPLGVKPICVTCKTENSTLWRRSPDGEILCNSCGLKHRPSGDGSEDGFTLRNSNKAQLRCIEAPDPAAISSTCGEWKQCLVAQKKTYEIKAFLRAGVGSDVPSVIQAMPGDMAAMTEDEKEEECVDPSVADPESWECECLEQMKVTCAGRHMWVGSLVNIFL